MKLPFLSTRCQSQCEITILDHYMSVTTYLGTSLQIQYRTLHVLILGGVHLPLAIMNNIEWRRGHSVVWQIYGGGVHLPLVSICFYMHWYFLIFSYKLTVSNGLLLMALKSKVFTLCSGSLEWGWGSSDFGI